MIDWSVPDVPESLQLKIKRENYLAKQALTDNIVMEGKVRKKVPVTRIVWTGRYNYRHCLSFHRLTNENYVFF